MGRMLVDVSCVEVLEWPMHTIVKNVLVWRKMYVHCRHVPLNVSLISCRG